MLETTLPFSGYNSFIFTVVDWLSEAIEKEDTPIFLTVGGITPNEKGEGPARIQLIEAEDLIRYQEKSKGYTNIVKNFISETKENLKDYKYKFVCYLTDLREGTPEIMERYNIEEPTADEGDEGDIVEIEFCPEEEIKEEPDASFVQIFMKEADCPENIWLTRIPITLKKLSDGNVSIKFHFEEIQTEYIDIVRSEILDELRES